MRTQKTRDRKINLLLWVGAAAFAVAVLPVADLIHDFALPIKWLIFVVCMAVAIGCFSRAVYLGWEDETTAPPAQRRRKMIALAGMVVCGAGFLLFSAAYFWPAQTAKEPPAKTPLPQSTGLQGGSGAVLGGNGSSGGKIISVQSPTFGLVKDIRLSTRKPTNSNTPLIEGHANIIMSGNRLRIFVDYEIPTDGDQWSSARIPIAVFNDTYREQQIDFVILHRVPYIDMGTQKMGWNFLWGNPTQPYKNNPYMPAFKSRTRLVFEGGDGAEQYYDFKIVKSDTSQPDAELQIVSPGDQWR